MKTVLLLLAVLVTFDACMSCSDPPNCIPRGGFCHPGNWHDCCCPDGCLGLIIGACSGSTRAATMTRSAGGLSGIMSYSILDESNNKLMQETVVIDKTTIASQAQLDRIVALYGNQTLYMDAHIDLYSDEPNTPEVHKSWRRQKIN